MSRIFNPLIEHKGKAYPALLTISGDKEQTSRVRLLTSENKIEIVLPNGSLSFSTAEVLKQLLKPGSTAGRSEMQITPSISLQLLQTDW